MLNVRSAGQRAAALVFTVGPNTAYRHSTADCTGHGDIYKTEDDSAHVLGGEKLSAPHKARLRR
jgi:hypothetical protein